MILSLSYFIITLHHLLLCQDRPHMADLIGLRLRSRHIVVFFPGDVVDLFLGHLALVADLFQCLLQLRISGLGDHL